MPTIALDESPIIAIINPNIFNPLEPSFWSPNPKNFFVTTTLRCAFANYENLLILTDPNDYKEAMIQLRTGNISKDFRTYHSPSHPLR